MIVGLTGGIGSGKTTVARVFERLGVPVYEADSAAKKLMDTDPALQDRLRELLGPEVVENGRIDRQAMAEKIFKNKDLLTRTNKIVHPAVGEDFKKWYSQQQSAYVIREAAILFESGSHRDCDKIVVVIAPEEMRIQRVMQRNGSSRQQVLERMGYQWPESEKLARADYVVQNDQTQSVIKQVLRIHEDLIRHAKQRS